MWKGCFSTSPGQSTAYYCLMTVAAFVARCCYTSWGGCATRMNANAFSYSLGLPPHRCGSY